MTCCVTGHRPIGFPFQKKEGNLAYIVYRNNLFHIVSMIAIELHMSPTIITEDVCNYAINIW